MMATTSALGYLFFETTTASNSPLANCGTTTKKKTVTIPISTTNRTNRPTQKSRISQMAQMVEMMDPIATTMVQIVVTMVRIVMTMTRIVMTITVVTVRPDKTMGMDGVTVMVTGAKQTNNMDRVKTTAAKGKTRDQGRTHYKTMEYGNRRMELKGMAASTMICSRINIGGSKMTDSETTDREIKAKNLIMAIKIASTTTMTTKTTTEARRRPSPSPDRRKARPAGQRHLQHRRHCPPLPLLLALLRYPWLLRNLVLLLPLLHH